MSYELFRILAVLILTAVIILVIKSTKPEFAMLTTLATSAVILGFLIIYIFPYLQDIRNMFEKNEANSKYFSVALKALGITYLTGFAADTCRDFGNSALAAKAELAGKCGVFILSVPLLSEILKTALGFAGQ